jgi:predicted  nucleic acid-binding Zn-ribbon protein
MNSEEKLKSLKKDLERLKSEKIRKEEQLRNLRQKRDDLRSDITTLGYTPENLPDEIEKLKKTIESELLEIEQKLQISLGIINEK